MYELSSLSLFHPTRCCVSFCNAWHACMLTIATAREGKRAISNSISRLSPAGSPRFEAGLSPLLLHVTTRSLRPAFPVSLYGHNRSGIYKYLLKSLKNKNVCFLCQIHVKETFHLVLIRGWLNGSKHKNSIKTCWRCLMSAGGSSSWVGTGINKMLWPLTAFVSHVILSWGWKLKVIFV